MVCDFCAQSIEKVFMKRIEVKGINVDLEDQKVVIYLEKETDIEDTTISTTSAFTFVVVGEGTQCTLCYGGLFVDPPPQACETFCAQRCAEPR